MKNSQQRIKNQVIKISSGLLACATLISAQAQADSTAAESFIEAIKNGKNLSSFRLRYEHADQDGITAANGTTLRSLIGWQAATYNGFSIGAQLIDVSKFQDHFNDGVPYSGPIYAYSNQPRNASYAKIIDPSYTGINQLFVDISAIDDTNIKLGRQQVNLDNVRFIGDIAFRQVMQVFDGISVLNKSIANTDIRLAHFESVRQINTKLRTDGALDIANIKYRFSPTTSLTGYGYFSSFDDLGYGKVWLGKDSANQSNRTLGLRLDGASKLNDDWKILYTAEYAKQQDYSGGDKNIDAHYYKLGGGAAYGNFTLRADQELLSSNDSKYAFQTPFGTNHLFQGLVDKFLVTPKQGMRDSFITATYKYADFTFFADYHWLNSDEDFNKVGGGTADKYGKEWNVAAGYSYNKHLMAKVEYGKFSEDDQYAAGRIKDTDKLWLTLNYNL